MNTRFISATRGSLGILGMMGQIAKNKCRILRYGTIAGTVTLPLWCIVTDFLTMDGGSQNELGRCGENDAVVMRTVARCRAAKTQHSVSHWQYLSIRVCFCAFKT